MKRSAYFCVGCGGFLLTRIRLERRIGFGAWLIPRNTAACIRGQREPQEGTNCGRNDPSPPFRSLVPPADAITVRLERATPPERAYAESFLSTYRTTKTALSPMATSSLVSESTECHPGTIGDTFSLGCRPLLGTVAFTGNLLLPEGNFFFTTASDTSERTRIALVGIGTLR